MSDSMENSITYSRAIECVNLQNLPQTDVQEYLKIAKSDWNLRAQHDSTLYVCAHSQASEAEIQGSGLGDVTREFLPRIQGFKHEIVLEIGCGIARMSTHIAGDCQQLYAVDISRELLTIAEARAKALGVENIVFMETDGNTLPGIPENTIDLAWEYLVFQHISSSDVIESYIKEVGRVLKPGGVFIFHGRDVSGAGSVTQGNTWHGVRLGQELVERAIKNTSLVIISEEGVNTERYWCILQKGK